MRKAYQEKLVMFSSASSTMLVTYALCCGECLTMLVMRENVVSPQDLYLALGISQLVSQTPQGCTEML